LVGIYFANRKISRSSRFKPHLKQFYEKINKDGKKKFEVVVVSLDKALDDYLFSYPEKSQWYALEFGHPLIKKLDIRYEPPGGFCMTIVTSDGDVVREEGDGDVGRDKGGKRTFQSWLQNAKIGAPPTKEAAPSEPAKPVEEAVAAPAEEAPLPVNSEGSTLAWTANGAEYILPWPMNRWRATPVDNYMVTADQLQLIFETKGLVTKAPRPGAKDPTIEDLIVKMLDTKYIVPKSKEQCDAENAEAAAKAAEAKAEEATEAPKEEAAA